MKVANYSQERSLLTEIGCRNRTEAILFLRGRAETGKTWLLRWLEEDCCDRVRVARVPLADRDRQIDPLRAMTLCANQLGWQHFEAYDQSPLHRPIGGPATISGNTISGTNITVMASSGVSEDDQVLHAIKLTRPFLSGLQRASEEGLPIVLCFDGYGASSSVTRQWVEQGLVPGILKSGSARLVLTSREPAQESLLDQVGDLLEVELTGIHEAEDWIRLAEESGLCLPGSSAEAKRERLIGAVSALEGIPGSIMQWLQVQSRRAA